MWYKNGRDIIVDEMVLKEKYIPRLNFVDEVEFQFLVSELTHLANELNQAHPFWKIFMFKSKRNHKKTERELKEFINFWSFDQVVELNITKLYGET